MWDTVFWCERQYFNTSTLVPELFRMYDFVAEVFEGGTKFQTENLGGGIKIWGKKVHCSGFHLAGGGGGKNVVHDCRGKGGGGKIWVHMIFVLSDIH